MPSAPPVLCGVCLDRASKNPSGKAKCNGQSPCAWCKRNGLECTYHTPPEQSKDAPHIPPTEETSMTIIDKLDGSRVIRFNPDPEHLGEVDAVFASEFCLAEDLPVDNYEALTKEIKRKRAETLVRFEAEQPPQPLAKRIRGGVEGLAGNEGQAGMQAPAPPQAPVPQQHVAPQQAPPPQQTNENNLTGLVQSMIEANAATQLLMARMLDTMQAANANRVTNRSPPHPKTPSGNSLVAGFCKTHPTSR